MEDLSDEEIEGLERSFDAVVAEEKRREEHESQFSIVDPPLRDRPTSQPAKAKESTIAAAPALSAEIRRRLDLLLKKNA